MANKSTELSQSYFRNKLILVSLGTGLFLNIVLWIILFIKFGVKKETVPLHFNIVYGIDYIGDSRLIYQIPAAGFLIGLINLYLGKIFYGFERFFSYVFSISIVGIQLMMLAAVLALIVLHG